MLILILKFTGLLFVLKLIGLLLNIIGRIIIPKKVRNLLTKIVNPYINLPKEAYVIFVSRIINAMGAMVGTIMPLILKNKIGLSEMQVGSVMTIAGFVLIVPPLIGGRLADTIGRKTTIVIFDILGLTSYIICGFLEPNYMLIVFMFLAAVFYSTAGPAHESILADISDESNRKQVFSLSYMGWNLGFAIGAALAGILYANHLWLVFIGDALTTLLSLSLIILFIKNVTHVESKNKNEQAETGSIFDVLFRRPKLILFALIVMGFNFVYSQWGFLFQMNLSDLFGDKAGARHYGFMASLNGVLVIAFTALISSIFAKTRNFKLIVSGGLLYGIGFGLLGVYSDLFPNLKLPYIQYDLFFFYSTIVIFTIGEMILTISIGPYIFNHTPSSHRGRMSAALGLIMGLGWISGPFITGTIFDKFNSYPFTWRIVGLVGITCAFLMYLLGKYDKPVVELDNKIDLQSTEI